MRVGLDPRVNQLLGVLNQLGDAAVVLPWWPSRKVEGPPSGGAESRVLVNVSGFDLACEIHGALVEHAERVAEERGVAPVDRALTFWRQLPSGSWAPVRGDTAAVVAWLRRHASWIVVQDWYVDGMWEELIELRRRARAMMGLSRPPRHLVEGAMAIAEQRGIAVEGVQQ